MNYLNNNESERNDTMKNIKTDSTKNPCNDTGKISGIYKIINKVNGKYYVGSSNDVLGKYGRWYEHRSNLLKNRHNNKKLQNAWNKYGENNFEYLMIENVNQNELLIVEQKYLDILKQDNLLGNDTHYNLIYDATSPAKGKMPWNKGKTGLQISSNKGKKLSLETRKKISENTKISMMKISEKMSQVRKGKPQSEKSILNKIDKTMYNFYNQKTGQSFFGTRYEFKKIYNIDKASIWSLITGKYKQASGWILYVNDFSI